MINKWRLIKNSAANVVNGFATTLMGISITPFLLKDLSSHEFSVWQVSMQLGALLGLFSLGTQLAVSRFTSLHLDAIDDLRTNVSSASTLIFASVLLSVVFLLALSYDLSILFGFSDLDFINGLRYSILLIGFGYIVNLLTFIPVGIFIGYERNEIPALINLFSKTILGLVLVVNSKYGLNTIALYFFIANLLTVFLMYFVLFLFERRLLFSIVKFFCKDNFVNYVKYSLGIAAISVSTFLITGASTLVVSRLDYSAINNFTIASNIIIAMIGFSSALLTPLLQIFTRMFKMSEFSILSNSMFDITKIISFFSILTFVIFIYFAEYFFKLYLGKGFSSEVVSIFLSLAAIHLVRLYGIPFFLVLVATGDHTRTVKYSFLDGFVNFVFCMIFVKAFGVIGVSYSLALSTLLVFAIYSLKFINQIMIFKIEKFKLLVLFLFIPMLIIFSGFTDSLVPKMSLLTLSLLTLIALHVNIFTRIKK